MQLNTILLLGAALVPFASTFSLIPSSNPVGIQNHGKCLLTPLRPNLHNSATAAIKRNMLTGQALQMRVQQYDTYISYNNFHRRMLASRIYSRMARSVSVQGKQTEESASDPVMPAVDPLKELTEQMLKMDAEARVTRERRQRSASPRTASPASPNSKSAAPSKLQDPFSKSESVYSQEVSIAFAAFGSALLRPKGRVRFGTLCQAFRQEFPTLASEDKLSNQTLGRKIQAWYKETTGKALRRSEREGSYIGLSMVNPRFTSADLSSLRSAQALFEPGMMKKFERLGLDLNTPVAQPVTDQKGKDAYEQRTRTRNEKRVEVHKTKTGKVIRVLRRADPNKGVKEKLLAGKKLTENKRETLLRQAAPVIKMCIESFANTLLVNEGTCTCTFEEVKTALHAQFPLLANKERLSDSYLGRLIGLWYSQKYGTTLVRRKTVEMGNITRAQVPYTNLSLKLSTAPGVDMQLLNEAKVALRKALKMEGVGVLVRRDAGGDYRVALIAQGSPAAVEGSTMIGDILVAVDSKPVQNLDLQELADAVLGVRGSIVKMTLARETATKGLETYSVELQRSDKPVVGNKSPAAQLA